MLENLNKDPNLINLKFIYNSQNIKHKTCRKDAIIEDVFKEYASEIGIDLKSVFFLHKGDTIDNSKFKLKVNQILKEVNNVILVYTLESNIIQQHGNNNRNGIYIIFILNSDQIDKMEVSRDDVIKNACIKYAHDKGLDFNSLAFKYGEKTIDLNQKFSEIANPDDKRCLGITIAVYKCHPLKIKFFYNNNFQYQNCFIEDKIMDVLNIYTGNISKNIQDLDFYYDNISHPIEFNTKSTFIQLIDINEINSKVNLNTNDSFNNSKDEILITVKDKKNIPTYTPTHANEPFFNEEKKRLFKKIGITMGIVILLAGIVCLIYIFGIRKEKNKNSSTINEPNSDFSKEPNSESSTETNSDSSTEPNSDSSTEPNSDSSTEPKSCGDGYFIPDDDETLQDCQKCSLEGCQKCNGTYEKNDCYSCGSLQSIYNNNKIIKCNNTCETGDEEKCLTCHNNKSECQSCNIGYQLVKGKCKSEYLIKVTYFTISPNEEIELTDMYKLDIKKMLIDGENVSPTQNYNFPEKGNHTVYFGFFLWTIMYNYYLFYGNERIISASILNFDEYIPCISFTGMFSGCTNLISVDISKISFKLDKMDYQLNLNNMFKDCINLKYVKLYNINATNAENMFYNCKSLVSIDLSNINATYINTAKSMFYNCISLKSINLKSFHLKSVTNINYMFYNCISLESIDL